MKEIKWFKTQKTALHPLVSGIACLDCSPACLVMADICHAKVILSNRDLVRRKWLLLSLS